MCVPGATGIFISITTGLYLKVRPEQMYSPEGDEV